MFEVAASTDSINIWSNNVYAKTLIHPHLHFLKNHILMFKTKIWEQKKNSLAQVFYFDNIS